MSKFVIVTFVSETNLYGGMRRKTGIFAKRICSLIFHIKTEIQASEWVFRKIYHFQI
jgi:hypothetical protein